LLGSLHGEVASAQRQVSFSGRPRFRFSRKETTGSPKFPCYPLVACPALGPRWCFRHSPSRTGNYGLPSSVTGSAFPPFRRWLSLMDHDVLYFGALLHGLLPHYTRPRTHHYWWCTRVRFWAAG